MTSFTFTTKETYLAYRADWVNRYNIISDNIRKNRKELNNVMRENKHPTYTLTVQRFKLRHIARTMLEELQEAKLEAGRQYNAQKELINA